MKQLNIGLFGTCGVSTWRTPFMAAFDKKGIPYFNPQVEHWTEEFAEVEAEHLADDQIILFPITSEEYSLGSLSEIGFSILNAIKLNNARDFVILISNELDERLDDPKLRKESKRARALVKQHLLKMELDNLYLVDTLEDMFEVSVKLYLANQIKFELLKFNPHRKAKSGNLTF